MKLMNHIKSLLLSLVLYIFKKILSEKRFHFFVFYLFLLDLQNPYSKPAPPPLVYPDGLLAGLNFTDFVFGLCIRLSDPRSHRD